MTKISTFELLEAIGSPIEEVLQKMTSIRNSFGDVFEKLDISHIDVERFCKWQSFSLQEAEEVAKLFTLLRITGAKTIDTLPSTTEGMARFWNNNCFRFYSFDDLVQDELDHVDHEVESEETAEWLVNQIGTKIFLLPCELIVQIYD